MTEADILDKLLTYLASEFPNPGQQLDAETNLLDSWFVDSLGITELVMYLEKEFGISMTGADMNGTNFLNPTTLAHFVAKRQQS